MSTYQAKHCKDRQEQKEFKGNEKYEVILL